MNNDTTPGNVMVERRIINAESERKDGVPVTEDFFSTIAPDFPFWRTKEHYRYYGVDRRPRTRSRTIRYSCRAKEQD
jgi:hypothetical protein